MDNESTLFASDGDTLCSIAVQHGFKNCTKLRDKNPNYKDKPLEEGHVVTVPAVKIKEETRGVEAKHQFVRKGKVNKVHIITDKDRANAKDKLGDTLKSVGISNYVPGRQGKGFADNDWIDKDTYDFNADAAEDPDHFRVLVEDHSAGTQGKAEVELKIRSQKPKPKPGTVYIDKWENLTEAGSELGPVKCKRLGATDFYISPYLRLVVDEEDRQLKRRDGRINLANDNGGTSNDTGAAVTDQVVLVTAQNDPDVEVLDCRVEAYRPAPDCEHGDADGKCRARSVTAVGKNELELKLKVVRIGGSAGTTASDAEIRQMVFVALRNRYAQANIGVKQIKEEGPGVTIVEDFIHDVAEPRNMIMISDYDGLAATGGATMRATVTLTTGDKAASITTVANNTPKQTADKLADALRAQGVSCKVSANPPIIGSPRAFGSCDILCFNPDGTMAPVKTVSVDAGEAQTIGSTAAWSNARVRNEDFYDTAADTTRGGKARMVGTPDYRSACKNFNKPGKYLCALVTKRLETAGLNGEAILAHDGITGGFGPLPEFRLAVFLSKGGVSSPVTLSHEGGHAMCDCFHTTFGASGTGNETDHAGNVFCNNPELAFTEWMCAFARNITQVRKRISDHSLTVWLINLKTGVPRVEGEWRLMGGKQMGRNPAVAVPGGGSNPTTSERLRTHSPSMFENMRQLKPVP